VADMMSILSAAYKSNVLNAAPSKTKYVAVDPALYEGKWTGKYANNKSFTIDISNVEGYHAKVKYQSDGIVKYQDVLIKDATFRIGDTKFTWAKQGAALVKNVVTDPATGTTYLDSAYARLSE
jgi:hypothetical protein